MQLRTKCPGCQKTLRCPTERIGTMVRCPACRHKFRLESLASGGDASLDAQPSMEAMQTIEQPPAGPAAAEPQSPEHTSGSRGSNESQSSRSRSSRSQASRSVSKGGQKRAAVASLPSLGRFGDYDLKAVLGKGGFGVVYRAWDETLGRQVAIKIPRFDLGAERKVKRFRQEARAAAKLQHPNIVGIITEGVENRRPYIVAEFVDGQPLSKTIEQSRPTHRQAAQWVRDLAGALHYAHQQGIVHRDIKPDNVMLDQDQRPRLMDFGLAKQLDEDSSLSVDGSVLGTPNYMAPEQARGEIREVDGRSDQYSLGVVLYELLTGEKPFSGPPHAVLAKVADANFEPPTPRSHDATISKDLEAICLRAISKQADQRYPDMQAMADDLDRWLEGKPTDARPLGPHERAVRWVRRNPALAGSGAALSFGLLIIVGLVWKLATGEPAPVIVQAEPAVASDSSVNASENPDDAPEASNTTAPPLSLASSVPAPPSVPPAPPAPPWQPTPEQQAFLDEVAALPVEEQAVAVAKKLVEINPAYDGEFKQLISDGTVIEFTVSTNEIEKLWPVRGLRDLKVLQIFVASSGRGKIGDISALAGWPLRELKLENQSIGDLSPLAGMPLENLSVAYNSQISDLSPIHGMPLKQLRCNGTSIENLMVLRGMQLRIFECARTMVSSLEPLEGMPIDQLYIYESLISDISPLKGVSLRRLAITPSIFCKSFEQCLRSLSAQKLGDAWNTQQPAKNYWESFESRQREAEAFVSSISNLSATERAEQIEAKIKDANNSGEIELQLNLNENRIDLAVLRLSGNVREIWPIRGLGDVKRLTISGGPNWLDFSPINKLPIEELICLKEQAMRNRLMLAEIATLKTINGQPADQYLAYLQSLSEPQVVQSLPTIPTEEEILAAHPPLDEWLQGREILTVAQDGSAMFTTIQAALDAQQDGQVVEVLDKGPYCERLTWKTRTDCGLVTRVNTVVTVPKASEASSDNHTFSGLDSFRISGFVFLYTPEKQNRSSGLFDISGTRNACIESIVVAPMSARMTYFYPNLWWTRIRGTVCIRDSVFSVHQVSVIFEDELFSSGLISRNWFRTLSGSKMCTAGLIVYNNVDADSNVLVSRCITDHRCTSSSYFRSDFGRLNVSFLGNTTVGVNSDVALKVKGLSGRNFSIQHNVSFVKSNCCRFSEASSAVIRHARESWNIGSNYGNELVGHSPQDAGLLLGPPHPSEIRVLSTHPLDRNFMRVDPASIQVPDGDPFPGALPPGPAPPEGDWFTRLQERFEEALQYIPEAEREKWTRPIELPKFTPATANVAAASGSDTAKPNEREPMQPAVEPQPVEPEDAEPAVGLRLDGRNSSFVEYDGPQPRRWVELDQQGEIKHTFEELRREDSYVVILDRSRDRLIRLPFAGGRVFYSTDGEQTWLNLGTFQLPPSEEALAAQQREQEQMAANAAAANNEVGAANAQAPAANVAQPAGANAARFDRAQLPKEMRELLRLPGMDEKMTLLEQDYLRYKRGFFVFGQITSQNTSIDPRLIDARMPVGPGGYFIDLVADAGRPIGFVLHGHAYKSVIPTGPPDGHEGVFAENLGNLVMNPLQNRETQKTDLYVRRLDVRGRSQPIAVNFKITTRVPEMNYFTDRIVRRGSGDGPGFVIQGKTLANGKFSLTGLSPKPTEYVLEIRLPGHLPVEHTLRLDSSLESVVVEEKIPIRIETILWKGGKFDLENVEEAWLAGGDDWRFNMPKPKPLPPGTAMMGGMGRMGGMAGRPFEQGRGGTILQSGGKLTFQISGLTTSAKDLGKGNLGEFLDRDPMRDMAYHDRDFQIRPGHVYLIRSYHTGGGMGPAVGRDIRFELDNSNYALVRVTLQ